MRRITVIEYKPGTQGPPGPQGPPGIVTEIDSSQVIYSPTGQTVEEVLDDLLFVDLDIVSFTTPQITFETGQVITSLTFTWILNKTITSQTITGTSVVPPVLDPADRSKTVSFSSLSSNGTVTLTCDDGSGADPVTRNIDITFLSGVLTGSAPLGTVNSAFLNTLSKSLQATRVKEFNVNLGVAAYGWYAIPSSYGSPTFKVNGFSGGMTFVGTVAYTNGFGYTQNYDVWRTTNSNLGVTNIEAE